jgi:hypothetical protein
MEKVIVSQEVWYVWVTVNMQQILGYPTPTDEQGLSLLARKGSEIQRLRSASSSSSPAKNMI